MTVLVSADFGASAVGFGLFPRFFQASTESGLQLLDGAILTPLLTQLVCNTKGSEESVRAVRSPCSPC